MQLTGLKSHQGRLFKMVDKENIQGLYASLAKAQSEFPVIDKSKIGKITGTSKNGKYYEYEYSYADLADILKTVLPILSSNDLCLTQPTKIDNGIITLITRITHVSGDIIESEYPVCSITGAHQQMGSALTYARRYGLSSLLAIATDDDVDGQGAETIKHEPAQQNHLEPQSLPSKQDDKTSAQKMNDTVLWLQNCTEIDKFQAVEQRVKSELKPKLIEGDWLRLEGELNATFNRISANREAETA